MSVSEAVLRLVIEAENLAAGAVGDLGSSIGKVAEQAVSGAGRIKSAFSGIGTSLTAGLGQAVEGLASGGDIGQVMATAGAFMAGELAQNFGEKALESLASNGLIAALTAPLAGLGTAMGGLISAAIPIGMALLPVILIAALVAAVAFLIANPEIVGKIVAFASDLVHNLIDALSGFLSKLPAVLGAAFGAAWSFIVNGVVPFIGQLVELWMSLPQRLLGLGASILGTIISGLAGLPGQVAGIIGDAFRSLRLDIGPFHITGSGVTVDLPHIDVPHFAGGVTNFAGGVALVGERGPELARLPRGTDVIPNSALRRGGGGVPVVIPVVIDGREVARVVDARLYYMNQRAPS